MKVAAREYQALKLLLILFSEYQIKQIFWNHPYYTNLNELIFNCFSICITINKLNTQIICEIIIFKHFKAFYRTFLYMFDMNFLY